jgi:hypothetical protein
MQAAPLNHTVVQWRELIHDAKPLIGGQPISPPHAADPHQQHPAVFTVNL